jgi:hypothetical protein
VQLPVLAVADFPQRLGDRAHDDPHVAVEQTLSRRPQAAVGAGALPGALAADVIENLRHKRLDAGCGGAAHDRDERIEMLINLVGAARAIALPL